jgi:hypothetical protein
VARRSPVVTLTRKTANLLQIPNNIPSRRTRIIALIVVIGILAIWLKSFNVEVVPGVGRVGHRAFPPKNTIPTTGKVESIVQVICQDHSAIAPWLIIKGNPGIGVIGQSPGGRDATFPARFDRQKKAIFSLTHSCPRIAESGLVSLCSVIERGCFNLDRWLIT